MADPMKMRVTLKDDTANIKVLMNHEMETGLRKDAKSGQLVPAHYIQLVTATLNGKPVMEAQWGTAVSKNPFLEFRVKGAKAGDKVAVNWVDNTGDKNSIEETIK
ncbi:MAG: thiosulfate oxidation carrier complex protein SoxZ [Sulfuricellaceae bacterium]|jgi:sulfur-oxidizing protein SoxZ